jgi:excisionase family DNA binding protein
MVGPGCPLDNEAVPEGPNGGDEVRGNGSVGADERLLTPAEVAALFRVDPKTVTRWAKAGKLSSIRTLGGHRRYWESEVRRLLEQSAIG